MEQKTLLEELILSLQCLPTVGRKSAQRMAYYLLDKDRQGGLKLAEMMQRAMSDIGNCESCRDYTEVSFCKICTNDKRDDSLLCVVESPSDIAAIESTANFSGKYFVLMGSLSPLDGIGPDEIGLDRLAEKVKQNQCKEVIIATSATVEGEATAHYIKALVTNINTGIVVTRLAQGVPLGGELEYIDASTLALSIANRQSL